MVLLFSPIIKTIWKKSTCASSAISFKSLVLFEEFYSNYNNSLQLHFQHSHCNENSPSTSSFPDNPPALEIGQDIHILTNLLTLLINFFLFFPSWIFILHQRSLYSQASLSSVPHLRDLICKTSSSSHHSLTTQISISAQDLSPYVQRPASVWHLCQCWVVSSH